MEQTNKQAQMLNNLEMAKKIMKKTDAKSPIVQRNIQESVDFDDYDSFSPVNEQQMYTQQPAYADSKLPKSILESIQSNPISDFNSTQGLSVLDSIIPIQNQNTKAQPRQQMNIDFESDEKAMPTTEELMARSRNLREQIQPGYKQPVQQPVYQQPVYQQTSSIDYSLIKMMIEECISKEIRMLKKTLLTEGKTGQSNGDVIMMAGDTIKFINKKGDVYEAMVKKTKHIDLG